MPNHSYYRKQKHKKRRSHGSSSESIRSLSRTPSINRSKSNSPNIQMPLLLKRKRKRRSSQSSKSSDDSSRSKSRKSSKTTRNDESYKMMMDHLWSIHCKKFETYKQKPQSHPKYYEEWAQYIKRRCESIKQLGQDPTAYNFESEWKDIWMQRLEDLAMKEWKMKIQTALHMSEGHKSNLIGSSSSSLSFPSSSSSSRSSSCRRSKSPKHRKGESKKSNLRMSKSGKIEKDPSHRQKSKERHHSRSKSCDRYKRSTPKRSKSRTRYKSRSNSPNYKSKRDRRSHSRSSSKRKRRSHSKSDSEDEHFDKLRYRHKSEGSKSQERLKSPSKVSGPISDSERKSRSHSRTKSRSPPYFIGKLEYVSRFKMKSKRASSRPSSRSRYRRDRSRSYSSKKKSRSISSDELKKRPRHSKAKSGHLKFKSSSHHQKQNKRSRHKDSSSDSSSSSSSNSSSSSGNSSSSSSSSDSSESYSTSTEVKHSRRKSKDHKNKPLKKKKNTALLPHSNEEEILARMNTFLLESKKMMDVWKTSGSSKQTAAKVLNKDSIEKSPPYGMSRDFLRGKAYLLKTGSLIKDAFEESEVCELGSPDENRERLSLDGIISSLKIESEKVVKIEKDDSYVATAHNQMDLDDVQITFEKANETFPKEENDKPEIVSLLSDLDDDGDDDEKQDKDDCVVVASTSDSSGKHTNEPLVIFEKDATMKLTRSVSVPKSSNHSYREHLSEMAPDDDASPHMISNQQTHTVVKGRNAEIPAGVADFKSQSVGIAELGENPRKIDSSGISLPDFNPEIRYGQVISTLVNLCEIQGVYDNVKPHLHIILSKAIKRKRRGQDTIPVLKETKARTVLCFVYNALKINIDSKNLSFMTSINRKEILNNLKEIMSLPCDQVNKTYDVNIKSLAKCMLYCPRREICDFIRCVLLYDGKYIPSAKIITEIYSQVLDEQLILTKDHA